MNKCSICGDNWWAPDKITYHTQIEADTTYIVIVRTTRCKRCNNCIKEAEKISSDEGDRRIYGGSPFS